MNNQIEPESTLANVDLEQWRRDIDVFAAATTSALDAIVNELSNACSGARVSAVSTKPTTAIAKHSPTAKYAPPESAVKRSAASHSPVNKSVSPSNGGSRLDSIKEKLASRIKKG